MLRCSRVLEPQQANLIETKLLTANWIQYLLNINSTRRQRSNFRCGEFMKKAERKLLTSWDFWGLRHWSNEAVECLTIFLVFPSSRSRKKLKAKENWKWDKFCWLRASVVVMIQGCLQLVAVSRRDSSFLRTWDSIKITSNFKKIFHTRWTSPPHHLSAIAERCQRWTRLYVCVQWMSNWITNFTEFPLTWKLSALKYKRLFFSPASFPCLQAYETLFAFVIYISCQPCQWKWKMALISKHRQFSIYSGEREAGTFLERIKI